MQTPEPFSMYSASAGNPSQTLLLLGEAPGEEEIREGKPFVGTSGRFLDEILQIAGLSRSQFHATNVFAVRPPGNDLKAWTLTKTDLKRGGFAEGGRLPQINKRYIHPDREPELLRLSTELDELQPDLIICLGGTALWALTGDSRITLHRGTFFKPSRMALTSTAIATFHPAAVLRAWDMRPIVWADLRKAEQWLSNTLPPSISRRLWINPTEQELADVYRRFAGSPADLLGLDIETKPSADQITTFAIGRAEESICIPLWNPQTLPGVCHCYGSISEEVAAWGWVRRFCELPNPKVLQNGLYDLQWLLDNMDLRPVNVLHDTAILQHALQPELPKDLGTLGSIYLNESGWKSMRTSKENEAKVDE